jgi:hypothetical protein
MLWACLNTRPACSLGWQTRKSAIPLNCVRAQHLPTGNSWAHAVSSPPAATKIAGALQRLEGTERREEVTRVQQLRLTWKGPPAPVLLRIVICAVGITLLGYTSLGLIAIAPTIVDHQAFTYR